MTDLARLVVTMEAQTAKFQADLDKANRKLSRFEKDTKRAIGGIQRGFAQLRNAATGFAGAFGAAFIANKFLQNTKEAQDALAQLNASLKSTGGVAGRSADQLVASAQALQKVTTFGDDAIIKMQSLLLIFKNIRGTNFDRATASVLDLSAKLGQDLNSSAQQVGKALNDPIRGITLLGKAGIDFTKDQKELIKSLVETGRVAEAQEILLGKLEDRFGGSAKAARDTLGGALAGLSNAFNDLFELSSEATGGVVAEVNKLTDTLSDPKIKQSADLLGAAIVRSLGFAITSAAKLVAKVQELGESLARLVSGPALDDVAFFRKEIQEIDEELTKRRKITPFFEGSIIEQRLTKQRKELAEQLKKAEAFVKEYGTFDSVSATPASGPVAEPAAVQTVMPKIDSKALNEVQAAINAGTEALEKQRNAIRENIETLSGFLAKYGELTDAQLQSVGLTRTQITEATAALGKLGQDLAATFLPPLEEIEVTARKVGEALSPMAALYEGLLAEVRSTTETELEATERRIFEFSLKIKELIGAGLITAEQGQEFIQRFVDQQQKPFSQLEEFGKQAARNIQTAFADFLFDPFSNGLKGMLKGFLDTIRRMVAEVAAQQILTTLFGYLAKQGGVLGSIGGALAKGLETRASGGPVRSNSAYLVGEKGPELLVGAAGKIIPGTDMGGGGNVTVAPTYNIDARGATTDLIKQLPGILTEHARQTVQLARAAIQDDLSRGMLRG